MDFFDNFVYINEIYVIIGLIRGEDVVIIYDVMLYDNIIII